MKIISALRQSVYGWIMILRNQAGWQERFGLTRAGLVTALVLFYLFAFLAVVLGSLSYGVPTPGDFVATLVFQSLFLLAPLIGIYGTRYALRERQAVLPLLVPSIYALTFYVGLGAFFSITLGILLPLLWLILIYMFFRLGRMVGSWNIGVSLAFAVLTVLLLAGTPIALYIMPAPLPAA